MYGSRPGVTAEWEKVFDAAARLGVAIELDGDPSRQDLDYDLARRARSRAVACSRIDSDAHATDQWWYAETALAHARLAGVPRDRVINCWPLARLLDWAAASLARRLDSPLQVVQACARACPRRESPYHVGLRPPRPQGSCLHMRYVTGLVILIAASMACSRGNDRAVVASRPRVPPAPSRKPRSPTSAACRDRWTSCFPAATNRSCSATISKRSTRPAWAAPPSGTFVDREGEVVWLQEYIRYRVNGCDHATAMSRVLTQIDGGAAGGICSAPPEGVGQFPAAQRRVRRAPHARDQVSADGPRPELRRRSIRKAAAIWITEYLRYRTNGAITPTAEARSSRRSTADPCRRRAAAVQLRAQSRRPQQQLGRRARRASKSARRAGASQTCTWTAPSTVPWLTFASTQSPGTGFTPFTYNIAPNNGGARTGFIDFAWQGGGARFQVNQTGDRRSRRRSRWSIRSARSARPTECWFRSAARRVISPRPRTCRGGTYTYNWSATYFYGTTEDGRAERHLERVHASSDACGGPGATVGGHAGRSDRHA